jgi:hypothetical protein
MPGIDETVGKIEGAGASAKLSMIEGDAAGAVRTLDAAGADPWRVVRDGLAVLTQEAAAPAATDAPPKLVEKSAEWSKLPGVRADIATALDSLDAVLSSGDTWNAYRPSAARLRALVVRAGDGLAGFPAWVPEASRERLGEDFTRGVDGALDREQQAAAEAKLERTAKLAAIAASTDKLDPGAAGQKARTALAQLMGVPVADPAGERRALASYERGLDLALAHFTTEDEKKLTRQLRPAWRALASMWKQAEPQVYTALPDLIRRPDAMTDPGIVATVNNLQRLAEDLRGLERLNEIVGGAGEAGKETDIKGPWAKLAARVLKLGQDLGRPTLREATLRSLRAVLTQTRAYAEIPGEEHVTDPVWDALTGGRGAALKEAIEKHRAAWLSGIEKGEPPEDEVARLAALRALLETLSDLAALEPAGLPGAVSAPYARLQARPEWELSPAALAELASGLRQRAAEATKAAMEEEPAKAAAALAKLREEEAVVVLAGHLAREAEGRGEAPVGGALMEVGAGEPARGQWLEEQAGDLAAVCRYAEEVPVSRRTASREVADGQLKFANQTAARLLEGMK